MGLIVVALEGYQVLTDLSVVDPNVIRHRCVTELVVWVEEEYGYRNWIWFPECSPLELERRWQATQHMSYDPPPVFLWGAWLHTGNGPQAEALDRLWACLFNSRGPERPLIYGAFIDGDDCYTKLVRPDESVLFHSGVEGGIVHERADFKLWPANPALGFWPPTR